MSNQKQQNQPSGFFFIDKPENCSSFDLIRDLRKKTSCRKFGHTGTLDPFASGLVILCLNKATKLSSLLINSDKEYLVKMELGVKTDTGDRDGQIIKEEKPPQLSNADLQHAVKTIRKLTVQKPPPHSAKKLNGKIAYKSARKGAPLDLPPQDIVIHEFEVIAHSNDCIVYRTKVSKGTYIRTLSETFAEYLNTITYTTELRRLAIGQLSVNEAVTPDKITKDTWQDYLKSINSIRWDFPVINLNKREIPAFINGNSIKLLDLEDEHQKHFSTGSFCSQKRVMVHAAEPYKDITTNQCLGIAYIQDHILHPKKVL